MEYDTDDTAARAYVGDPCVSPPTQLIETRLDRPELVAAVDGMLVHCLFNSVVSE